MTEQETADAIAAWIMRLSDTLQGHHATKRALADIAERLRDGSWSVARPLPLKAYGEKTVTYLRGLSDARRGYPPVDSSLEYVSGYAAGVRSKR